MQQILQHLIQSLVHLLVQLQAVSAVTAGSKVITSNFTLDTGQRDNFYDIARIVRKRDVVHLEVDY